MEATIKTKFCLSKIKLTLTDRFCEQFVGFFIFQASFCQRICYIVQQYMFYTLELTLQTASYEIYKHPCKARGVLDH
jgi:hypothetical protein